MIKLALFDFDNTLVVWSHKSTYRIEEEYYAQLLTKDPDYVYREAKVPEQIKKFVNDIVNLGIPIYLVSMTTSFGNKAKEEYVVRHISEKFRGHALSAVDSKSKIDIARALCRVHNINKNECLIVDDLYEVTDTARNTGFIAMYPQQIYMDSPIDINTYDW